MAQSSLYKKISENVKKKIGKNFIVSYMPDHPLIMDAPEILIGGEGRLTCLVTDSELKSIDKLRSKLMLCRLALPENARIILSTESNKVADSLENDFDKIVHFSEVENCLISFVGDSKSPKTDIKQVRETKLRHHNLYSKIFFINQRRSSFFDSKIKISEIYDKFKIQDKKEYLSRISEFRLKRTHTKRQISAYCLDSINKIVDLDNGTPHLSYDNFYQIILSDFRPVSKIDPEKPLRALAFSAQAITDAESENELMDLIDKIDDLINKRRTWDAP